MANNPNTPRTAFHRRLQDMTAELKIGYGEVSSNFNNLNRRLETDLKSVSNHLDKLTEAVKGNQSQPGLEQILQVKVQTVVGDRPREMITVQVGETLSQAVEVMLKNGVSTILVLYRNKIVGMVSASQVLKAVIDDSLDQQLKACMVNLNDFHCLKQSDRVKEALEGFRTHRVKRLFIIDDQQQVIGILTLGALLRWLADRLPAQSAAVS